MIRLDDLLFIIGADQAANFVPDGIRRSWKLEPWVNTSFIDSKILCIGRKTYNELYIKRISQF